MRRVLLFLSILLWANFSHSQSDATIPVSEDEFLEYQITSDIDEKYADYMNLKMAKKFLIAGDTVRARHFIERIDSPRIKLQLIRRYYLALIEFIEGNYKESLRLASDRHFYDARYFKNVCTLKIFNLLALPPSKKIADEMKYCLLKTEDYSQTDHLWLRNFALFKLGDVKALQGKFLESFKYVLTDAETIRVWLKTGLYLNKENILAKYLSTIPQEFYEYNSIRELMGIVHYRLGNYEMAQSFIEDLSSTNAENVRGNIKLQNSEYELAFGHFKLALKSKKNSVNALERILALSWSLEQWKDGLDALENLSSTEYDASKKRIMRTAFLLEMDKLEYADRNLHLLEKKFPNEKPHELQILRGYYGLKANDKDRFYDGYEAACKGFDGLSCWWLHKSFDYLFMNKTITREEKISESIDVDLDKLKNSRFKTPIDDTQFIHQEDIEEMDGVYVRISTN